MFQLDEEFLEQIGLGSMPDNQKKPFLQHIYQELEVRVGTKLSDGMSDEQLDEFGSIAERDEKAVDAWLKSNLPNYVTDSAFKQSLAAANGDKSKLSVVKADYAAAKWLELNRPDYKKVVSKVLDELRQEIINNKEAILN